ncbi:ABC transporter substrate-binding protein [Gracilimonas sp.]|uniref:ABC transporter substrate-binding protein n=1 Tax=Gracilimonas sp. TaxID=1974203 RepID=UPI003BAAA800
MKRLLSSLLLLLTFTVSVFAQSIETGIEFYEEGNYERALRIFEQSDSPSAQLFAGKSHYALNNFIKAKEYLRKVDSTSSELFSEAKYTASLADFQLKNFAPSLDALHELKENSREPSISRAAFSLYRDVVNYLTLEQRFNAFRATKYDAVRLDLVEAGVGKLDLVSARALFKAYKTSTISDTTNYASIEALLSDSAAYMQRYNPNRYTKAPSGLAYNIGVALPQFDIDSPQFEIPQHLYFGIQLAVEKFNSENTDLKAFLTYKNTGAEAANAPAIANELAWNHDADVIIGPLFSEVAVAMSQYAELYEIPMLTPLANSDSLNLDHNYTYQLNPTFAIQGQRMAQFAIRNLGYDTLAVIAERGSLGEPSAVAFLDEARKLGGEVVRYYVEELESEGYDISKYARNFDPEVDTVFNYNIDAVYAPFTGNIAETLISSLLTNLEAIGTDMTVLGSEEWEMADIDSRNLPDTEFYYTKTFEQDPGNTDIEDFESEFRLRFDTEPNRFALIGYDAANVALRTLKRVQNPAYLKEGLKKFNNYRGLIMDVSFENTHINQEVSIKQLQDRNRASDN